MDIPATAPSSPDDLARMPRLADPAPGERMKVRLSPSDSPRSDIGYVLETSPDLQPGNWTEVLRYMPGQLCGSGSLDVVAEDGGGVLIVFPETLGADPGFFARLRFEQLDMP